MPNARYRRGRAYEYRTVKLLEHVGYTACRTAGSHGCYDVMAINHTHIRLIQVKCGDNGASPAEREAFKLLPAPPNATKELWHFRKRGQPPLIAVL
jgi:Holliday junction resolvase